MKMVISYSVKEFRALVEEYLMDYVYPHGGYKVVNVECIGYPPREFEVSVEYKDGEGNDEKG